MSDHDYNDFDGINDTPRIPRQNYLTVVDATSTTADPHPAYAAGQTAAATPGD